MKLKTKARIHLILSIVFFALQLICTIIGICSAAHGNFDLCRISLIAITCDGLTAVWQLNDFCEIMS